MFARPLDSHPELPAFRTVELRPGAGSPALATGTYAVRLTEGRVSGVHGPMRRSRRGLFLPYEYAEFTYQTSPGVLTAMERWLADHADSNAAAAPGTGRQVALAVGIGVFVSCALSWFVLTG